MMKTYCKSQQEPLTEKVHADLLNEAKEMDEFGHDMIYVCPVCGFVMTADYELDRCKVCGAPARQFRVFEAKQPE